MWYRGPDLNRQAVRRRILSPTFTVSKHRHGRQYKGFTKIKHCRCKQCLGLFSLENAHPYLPRPILLTASDSLAVTRCAYRCVLMVVACPRTPPTVYRSTPAFIISDAAP